MAVLSTIENKKDCGGVGINTGTLGCQIEFGTPLHAIGMRKGFKIPNTQDFNLEYINEQIQNGTFIPLISASAFEDLSAEDTFSTNSAGQERLNLKGLPKYRIQFEEGHEFYRELSKITSYKSLDFIIGDDLSNWKMAEIDDENYGGFTAGQVTALMTATKVQGGDAESKSVTIQFLNRAQWDSEYAIFSSTNLGFHPEDIMGINKVKLSFETEPSNSDTVLSVKALLWADNNTIVTGLSQSNFRLTKNGTVEAISAITESNGVYSLTVAALATNDVLVLSLYDGDKNLRVIISNDNLYSAEDLNATVVA